MRALGCVHLILVPTFIQGRSCVGFYTAYAIEVIYGARLVQFGPIRSGMRWALAPRLGLVVPPPASLVEGCPGWVTLRRCACKRELETA